MSLRRAVLALRRGGVVAYPTEAVYGLGCDPSKPDAVRRLLALKRRSVVKGLILIAANSAQLRPYVGSLSAALRARWPGPRSYQVALDGKPFPLLGGGRDSIVVRITACRPARALLRAYGGALVSTSANRAGQPALRSSHAVRHCFGRRLDHIIAGRTPRRLRPSTIRASDGQRLR